MTPEEAGRVVVQTTAGAAACAGAGRVWLPCSLQAMLAMIRQRRPWGCKDLNAETDASPRYPATVAEADGFYFVDHLVDAGVAAIALRRFLDEALRLSHSVDVTEP